MTNKYSNNCHTDKSVNFFSKMFFNGLFCLSLIFTFSFSALAEPSENYENETEAAAQEDTQPQYNPYLQKAIESHKKHRYSQAISLYDKAIQFEPNTSELYFDRGLAKSESGDAQGAWHDFNRAIKLDPQNDPAYFNRGIVEFEMQQYKAALRDFNETIRLVPGDAKALYNRALTKQALGDIAGALKDATESRNYYKILHKRAEYMEVSDFINSIRSRGVGAY